MKDLDVADLARRYQAGESLGDIGDAVGLAASAVGGHLRRLGVQLRDRRSALRAKLVKAVDVGEIIRRYAAGDVMEDIAATMGVSITIIRDRLKKAGVTIRDRAEVGAMRRKPIDDAEVVRRYRAGESEQAISLALDVSRPVVRRRLLEAGVPIRGLSESMTNRHRRMSPEQRLALAQAAHAAVRGVPQSEENLCKRAVIREARPSNVAPSERTMAEWLRGLGIDVVPQKAVGPYNIDVALTESRIAVDIFGGNWHTSGSHARRYRPRIEYFLDRGWHPVVIWVTSSYRLARTAAEQVVALHQARCRGESLGRQEHVIRGDGYVAAFEQVKPHNGAIVLGFNPGNPNRGDDGRFR